MNKRELAAEETREKLLSAGEELAREMFRDGKGDPLRLLGASEISERAGRTRGMLYHMWPVEKDEPDKLVRYREELFVRIFERAFDTERLESEAQRYMGRPMAELVRGVADFDFRRYGVGGPEAKAFRFSTAVAMAGESLAPSLSAKKQAELHEQGPYRRVDELYRMLLDAYGREMVPPFEVEDLVETLWSMLDGFTLNSWHFDRLKKERAWDEAEGPWTLFSISVLAVVQTMTREKRDDGDEVGGA